MERDPSRVAMKRQSAKEGGAALIETVILLPLLLTALLGISDLYFYADAYMSMAHTSREALLSGSGLRGFKGTRTNLSVSLKEYLRCLDSQDEECGHKVVQWRIQRLVESHQPRIDTKTLQVASKSNAAPSGETISLTVSADYVPISALTSLFASFTVGSHATMYHLVEEG